MSEENTKISESAGKLLGWIGIIAGVIGLQI